MTAEEKKYKGDEEKKEVCEEKHRDEDKLLAGEGTDGETELTRRVRKLFLQAEALIIKANNESEWVGHADRW